MKARSLRSSIHALAVSGLLAFSQADGLSQINLGVNSIGAGPFSSIAGGDMNTNDAAMSTIGGGYYNWIDLGADMSFIGGGQFNRILQMAHYNTLGGGVGNTIDINNYGCFIGGGSKNFIASNSQFSTISGGVGNMTLLSGATIGGGEQNNALQLYATVAGGYGNGAGGLNSFIGGGTNNRALDFAVIGGGLFNSAPGRASIIGGGEKNTTFSDGTTIGGGLLNTASNNFATVGGGLVNSALGFGSVVPGGSRNRAFGFHNTIAGGTGSVASNNVATVGGGFLNWALSPGSTIPGGMNAQATNYGQFAYASGAFSANGDAQSSMYILRRNTTIPGWHELFLDGVGQRMHISPGATWSFEVMVSASSVAGNSAGYRLTGVIENFGGATTFVAPPVLTVLGEDLPPWNAMAVANNLNDALTVWVIGTPNQNIRWVATVRITEAKF